MNQGSKQRTKISRRRILPILGGSFLIPFLGFGSNALDDPDVNENEDFQTLLKPDGTTVKVKISALKNSKVVKKKMSNKSFLKWLGKKL